MISLIRMEIRKLNGSLALLLAVVAPAFPALLVALSVATTDRASRWSAIFDSFMLPLWALFMMPMVVAAFTTLVAQIEYQARGWDYLLSLPIHRWKIFLAKAVVVLLAMVTMTLLSLIFTWLGALLGGLVGGHPPTGAIPFEKLANVTALLTASALLFVAMQTWVALRFSSFVVSLAFGIGGTMVALAVAMTGTKQADWFPWVLPMKVLSTPDPIKFALVGGLGGLLVLAIMVVDLSRRNFR